MGVSGWMNERKDKENFTPSRTLPVSLLQLVKFGEPVSTGDPTSLTRGQASAFRLFELKFILSVC